MHVETDRIPWQAKGQGREQKPLAPGRSLDFHSNCLWRLAPGAGLPQSARGNGSELFLLEGDLQLGNEQLGPGAYLRLPDANTEPMHSPTGCTLFAKTGPFSKGDDQCLQLQTERLDWMPGHGGLRVKSLHEFEGRHTALVHWPEGEQFILHRHFGGEEILVLQGLFQDEHGSYPKGTWIQSPHGSSHNPFVEQETVILVKTGHLPVRHNERA